MQFRGDGASWKVLEDVIGSKLGLWKRVIESGEGRQGGQVIGCCLSSVRGDEMGRPNVEVRPCGIGWASEAPRVPDLRSCSLSGSALAGT